MSDAVQLVADATHEIEKPFGTRLLCLAYAVSAMFAALAWQAATVHFNYGGNWTGLFCTGARFPPPPELAAGTRTVPNSYGFDGQFYRYVAHDPWNKRGWASYCDSPVVRRMRILVPALAWCLALGQDAYIDAAYIGLIALSIFLGVYWLGQWIALHGRSPAWGLGFLAMPATVISIDRLTIDVTLLALCAGVLWYAASGASIPLYTVLLAAPLVRDTGLLLVGGYCAYMLARRLWKRAALFATAAFPVFAWFAYVVASASVHPHKPGPRWLFQYPVVGLFMKLFRPVQYRELDPAIARLAQASDALALCGFILVFGFGAWMLCRRHYGLVQYVTAFFIVLTIVVSCPFYWGNVYSYGRPLSPLILLAASRSFLNGPRWLLVSVVMMDLRIGLQWGPQIMGIVRGWVTS